MKHVCNNTGAFEGFNVGAEEQGRSSAAAVPGPAFLGELAAKSKQRAERALPRKGDSTPDAALFNQHRAGLAFWLCPVRSEIFCTEKHHIISVALSYRNRSPCTLDTLSLSWQVAKNLHTCHDVMFMWHAIATSAVEISTQGHEKV
jgi:hypothetical protein